MRKLIGSHDFLFVTLDSLRYDVAEIALKRGVTPNLSAFLPQGKWEKRETPGNFTYAAHHAFFSGFLPVHPQNSSAERLFAATFPGSETTGDDTFTFSESTLVEALRNRGYYTLCIGGVGFFNKMTSLGSVFPDLFDESHWTPGLGVTDKHSTENQVSMAMECLKTRQEDERVFTFVNVSAIHQPNCIFSNKDEDSIEAQVDALAYVDQHLTGLIECMNRRAPLICIICSDHGTAYGEDGYYGHRLNHPVVLNVPYVEFVLKGRT